MTKRSSPERQGSQPRIPGPLGTTHVLRRSHDLVEPQVADRDVDLPHARLTDVAHLRHESLLAGAPCPRRVLHGHGG